MPLIMLPSPPFPLLQKISDIDTPERHSTLTESIALHLSLRYGSPIYSADIVLDSEGRECNGNLGMLQHDQAGPVDSLLTPFW